MLKTKKKTNGNLPFCLARDYDMYCFTDSKFIKPADCINCNKRVDNTIDKPRQQQII